MAHSSTLVFELAKFVFSANIEVSTGVTFFRSVFVAWLDKSNVYMSPKPLNGLGKYWLIFIWDLSFKKLNLKNLI